MKANIFLLALVVFIISLIITLNIFFQQTYQSEMAEQFNSQQLIIAKSVAKNIEDEMQHVEAETLSLARLLSSEGLNGRNLGDSVYTAYVDLSENSGVDVVVMDAGEKIRFSSIGEKANGGLRRFFDIAKQCRAGEVRFVDMLEKDREVVVVTPIADGKRFKGALIVEMPIDVINRKFLAPIKAGIRGHAWMMDSEGTLLYHPTQPEMVGRNLYKVDASCFKCHKSFDVEKKILESGDIGFSSYIAPYGEDKLIAFSRARISSMSWIVCVSIPYSEVTFSIRNSMKIHSLLVISIFLATLTGAVAIVLMNRQRIKAEEKAKHLETQKQLEKEVVEAKDYLENILESTESKIMVLDKDLTVRTVNSAYERFSGVTNENVAGKSFFEVFPVAPADRDLFGDIFKKCLGGGSHRLSNYPFRRTDTVLNLNISLNPLILHGQIEGVILSNSDVTEEVKLKTRIQEYAERLEEMVVHRTDELQEEKEKLDAIVSAIEGGLFVMDSTDRRILWANKIMLEWLGVGRADELKPEEICSEKVFKLPIDKALESRRMVQAVVAARFSGKSGYFQITVNPLPESSGHAHLLVLIQDITEMKKIEERMMHSEKLSALARISAGVAHEIGNPLTSVSSYVQILREMDHDQFTKESLDTIAKHINRIADIVRQMSSFSRTKTSELRHHDMRELVDMTLDLVKYDKRMKNMRTAIDIPADLPPVVVDDTQFIQVLMNIVLNAADVMPQGGTLDISARKMDSEVEISVADSGPGIPAEHMEKIFDPFFTTKEKGTGLGLAVSYSIIKGYQGDILVENKPGGGTIFRVRLPFYES